MARDTRTRMLETTARLLQHRGYHGTALSDILAASGAPRGSLYFHFPGGKDQLVIEATRLAVAETSRFLRATLDAAPGPAEGVRQFFAAAGALLVETDYSFGCPVAPVILDAPDALPELAEVCRQAFEEWVGLFRARFEAAGIPAGRAERLALLVEAAMEGLLLIARAHRDTGALDLVAEELAAQVAAAVPASYMEPAIG
ncbi:MAG TPA: TetR/AcrR family transcriptional regulator [Amaricoccus sp.]|nr:TetR/AcrR family transcriptional regulator [Amaricoccus sp.]